MDNTWVAQFYEETDPVKRMEMLEAHGEDAAGEEAVSYTHLQTVHMDKIQSKSYFEEESSENRWYVDW